jgi:hypothetical protein
MTSSNKHIVASITKAPATELRVRLTTCHAHKVELRDFTATIPNVYFPAGSGVSLDVEKLHLLKGTAATLCRGARAIVPKASSGRLSS